MKNSTLFATHARAKSLGRPPVSRLIMAFPINREKRTLGACRERGLCVRHALERPITFRPKTLLRLYHGPAQDLYRNAIQPASRKQAKLDTDLKELKWLREL